jgi:alpha-galactosidase
MMMMSTTSIFLLLSFLLLFPIVSLSYDNGLGLTPAMGWNSWNHFGCNVNETLILETAQKVIDLGLDELGYTFINIDDCWQVSRNETGYIEEDPVKFPSGIRALSDKVHSLGLKFGLYSDAGLFTCQRRPGGLYHETKDAASYKEFNIDYLKYDNCYTQMMPFTVQERYQRMHDALNATGHPIFFSLCEWGVEDPATWAASVGNSWRTTGDISASWESILSVLDQNNYWHEYAGPGGWNDPDMLEVGNGKLSVEEQRSHFTLWALVKAPLLLGCDLQNIKEETLEIIKNEEMIAVNQDELGVQGYKRSSNNDLEVWAGPLANEDIAVVLFNRSPEPAMITGSWNDIGIVPNTKKMYIRDLWKHADDGPRSENVTAWVHSHDVVAFRLSPVKTNITEIRRVE